MTTPAPVWTGTCADPFALRVPDGYVMYGTGGPGGDRAFQVLSSPDLVTWTDRGGALERLADEPPQASYWAPEVAHVDGTWVMYYSVGSEQSAHHLRVATSRDPLGPFVDAGVDLSPDLPFAIDPSPFQDRDGTWWLFFATDELSGERPGTVLAVQRLESPTSLAGSPQLLLRATADWQRFEADREIYGARYDWHTLEGPHVVHRAGRYWMFFSAGNFQDDTYGVGLAVADAVTGPWSLVGSGASVLHTGVAGLIGPGHNSVLTDAAGDDHLVFHAYDTTRTRRQPYVVPLGWDANGPRPDWDAA
ncbi:glycosyl hydrolase family 43 [Motilibacter peucedani]|uniref:Glycosyl hydrolase family 43 n=1 Tax=Motilibacter peucedani TaxID=598650 RepID=A0A420XTX6_9ACTN|nr:glycoside hydrolase family 43 protein [Motilibacter peucedani]RKS80285.1 glycosyl hydrolase family 43 [Motilibacter peucedani]